MKTNAGGDMRRLVEQVLSSMGHGQRLVEARIMIHWEDTVGPQIARWSMPLRLQSGILTVGVFNSTWMNQLSFLRDEMAGNIRSRLDIPDLASVKLVLQEKPGWWPLKKEAAPPARPCTPEDQSFLEEACRSLPDGDLREIVERVLRRQLTRGR